MSLEALGIDVAITLRTFRVGFKKLDVLVTMSVTYEIPDFGIIVCVTQPTEFGQVATTLNNRFEGYRIVYITPEDDFLEKKADIFWDLMRSGYITYLRTEYPRQFNEMIRRENLDKRIITKRLEVWDDRAKYRWLISENQAAKAEASSYVLSVNPSFFDYMPEQ